MLAHAGPILAQSDPYVGPSWPLLAHVGSKLSYACSMLAHVGPMLAQVGPYVGPSWLQVGPCWPMLALS